MLIQELKGILQDQAQIFQDTNFESSKIHLLTIMYRIEHKNHDILLNFFINSFYVRVICMSNIFHI